MSLSPGQVVTIEVTGTLRVGGMTFTDCSFQGVKILRKNADGSYQVDLSFVANAPGMNDVTVEADWIKG